MSELLITSVLIATAAFFFGMGLLGGWLLARTDEEKPADSEVRPTLLGGLMNDLARHRRLLERSQERIVKLEDELWNEREELERSRTDGWPSLVITPEGATSSDKTAADDADTDDGRDVVGDEALADSDTNTELENPPF